MLPFPIRRWLAVACPVFLLLFVVVPQASGTVFGSVRGVVHDPQHHPVSQAQVTLQANDSQYKLVAATSTDGEFHFDAVALGVYTVNIDAAGFAPESQVLQLTSGSAPVMHFQ